MSKDLGLSLPMFERGALLFPDRLLSFSTHPIMFSSCHMHKPTHAERKSTLNFIRCPRATQKRLSHTSVLRREEREREDTGEHSASALVLLAAGLLALCG